MSHTMIRPGVVPGLLREWRVEPFESPRNLEVKTDWDPHERSVGPVQGYHLALCAYRPSDDPQGFVGYYKVCASAPGNYWDASAVLKGSSRIHRDPEQALREAEMLGRHVVGNLPPRGWRTSRPRTLLELRLVLAANARPA